MCKLDHLVKLANFQMPLEMSERTLPTIPKPPEELRADSVSPTSVQLRWNPKYPPNGKISVFTVRIGINETEDSGMTKFSWKRRFVNVTTHLRVTQK